MGDITADYNVEQQRKRVELLSLRTNAERTMLEIMDLDSRRAKALTALNATKEAIENVEAELEIMVEAHGKVKRPNL